jgi:peroxiredoxin
LASYARQYDRFEAAGLTIAAVSVDSVEQNAAMVDKLLLPFPLLADPAGDVIRSYDVWSDGEGGIAKPALFLVRRDSSVAYSFVGNDFADRPPDDDLFAAATVASGGSPG